MQARTFTHRVTIQRDNGNTSDGHGGTFEKWEPLHYMIPALVKPVSSRELWSAGQVKTQATHRIYVRYSPEITTKCRVLFEDRTFSITGIIDQEERHIVMELSCLEQVQ